METPKITENEAKLLKALTDYLGDHQKAWQVFFKITGQKPVKVVYS